jgi:hypothetical protein
LKVLATAFLCLKKTPKGMFKALYLRRWHVEPDLGNIGPL